MGSVIAVHKKKELNERYIRVHCALTHQHINTLIHTTAHWRKGHRQRRVAKSVLSSFLHATQHRSQWCARCAHYCLIASLFTLSQIALCQERFFHEAFMTYFRCEILNSLTFVSSNYSDCLVQFSYKRPTSRRSAIVKRSLLHSTCKTLSFSCSNFCAGHSSRQR